MESIDDNTIVILTADLAEDKNQILKSEKKDKFLIEGIEEFHFTDLEPRNIEVFEKHNNIYITEEGYYLAVYVGDIDEITKENKIENQ